ncbi:MAG: hypothetical protein HRU20_21955 [Pseudomonadales bacterium]|nr:hypothetical protein [Pseudomonadales bacterium]
MEFYSERCSDWLEKNPNIHPNKLAMEVKRFQGMLDKTPATDADSIDDLQLTVQLLDDRIQSVSTSQTEVPKPQNNNNWDTSSLTQHGETQVEVLDPVTKAQRKSQILTIPGVQLGTATLKRRDKN